ncbi:carbonate dehydratase [Gaeumannomyces tritici R3-111a-1]|uniref:Carbonic anhydrase n=1 Tax=Gaeumannomyces tritici (strain R3-111a-1) TaxID=644352 RepID=J3NYW5_GAET3|nr:carbonate dehydratase [Gaeumannomyces tritici R3-111a-1]EJT76548.1 carbonate dehydratase [Gaeumannomyces tritici R3-111a-1]
MGVRDTTPRPGYSVVPCPPNLIPHYVGPKQEVLWIGCSDSGFEETTVLDIPLEESIVLRDVANMALPEDLAAASMMQYAVDVLRVRHIVICGHYECGIVKASDTWNGLKGPWFHKLQELRNISNPALQAVDSEHRDGRFVELNVLEQMKRVHDFPEVKAAAAQRDLKVHGIVYSRTWNKAVQLIPDGQETDWLHR